MTPPMVMADTLTAVMLMPLLCAASSSSPTARSTAPAREWSSHHKPAMTRITTAQMNSMTSSVRPAVLRKVADLAEALGAVRPELEISGLHLIGEIEEEQTHRLAECDRSHHQHQALHPQGRETDGAGHRAGDDGGRAERGTSGQCASTVSMPAT